MNTLGVFIVIITVVSVTLLDRSKNEVLQKVLNWLPAILFAYIIPAAITHLFHLELNSIAIHNWSKNFIMPFAIITVMSALSFRQLRIVGIRPIVVFVSGSMAIAIIPFLLILLFRSFTHYFEQDIIGAGYWEGMITMVGSWIGGSTSQLILKEITGCPEGLFLAILVMDNVLVNIWTILMFQFIKRSDAFNKKLKINDPLPDFIPDDINTEVKHRMSNIITVMLCIILVVAFFFIEIPFVLKVLLLSVIGLILGNFLKQWEHGLVIKLGGYAIILIMAILGLKLNFSNFSLPIPVIIFSIIWLSSHYLIMMFMCKILNLNMAWVPIGSMANVGGISTAPAVTKAYNEELMPHAILLAILSMVTGTYWGLLTVWLFQQLI